MLQEAQPSCATQERLKAPLLLAPGAVLALDLLLPELEHLDEILPTILVSTAASRAYVIYTSVFTGWPRNGDVA